jgi:3-hydroxyacyl-[acyl-carrier-protein] dehydratase
MPGECGALISGTATRPLAADHPAANGHFPGNPIIPGAVLLREIVAAISASDLAPDGDPSRCREIRSAKFHHPVRPGDTIVVSWTARGDGDVRFSCSVAGSAVPAVTGALRLTPP